VASQWKRRSGSAIRGAGGNIEPKLITICEVRQSEPVEDLGLVLKHVKDNRRRRTVEEVDTALRAGAPQTETANTVAGEAREVVLAVGEVKAKQIEQTLVPSLQVPSETEKPLTVLAERVETDRRRPAVRPEDLVTFERDVVLEAVA
jgi:hypothetical protein